MKRWILLAILAFVAGIWLFQQIQRDAGYLLIHLQGVTLETTFWFAVFALFVMVLALVLCLWLVRKVLRSVLHGHRWWRGQRHQQIERRYREGLLHLLTGNWQAAYKQLDAVSRRDELPVVRALASAQAATHLHDYGAALRILSEAEERYPDDRLWILKARLPILIADKQHEQAKRVLDQIRTIAPQDPLLRTQEMRLVLDTEQADAAVTLLPKFEKQRVKGADSDMLAMEAVIAALDAHAHENEGEALTTLWGRVPKSLRQEPVLVDRYAQALHAAREYALLEELISFTMEKRYSAVLAQLYAKTESGDVQLQLKKVERWHKTYGDEPDLLMALAILAMKNQIWGKARSALEKHLKTGETPEALHLLGLIAEKLDDRALSYDYFRRGSGLARSL